MSRAFRLVPDNPLEAARQREIIQYLRWEPTVPFFVRINSGRLKAAAGVYWSYLLYLKGLEVKKGEDMPDIIGLLADGRLFAIEVKRPDEDPTPGQQAVLERVRKNGGVSGIAETWRDAKKIITGVAV